MKTDIQRVSLHSPSAGDISAINKILGESNRATIYHTLEWNQLLIKYSNRENVTLLAYQNKEPVGLYSFYVLDDHRCFSSLISFFTIYGGPIATNNDPEVIAALLRAAERLHPFSTFDIWTPPDYDATLIARHGYSTQQTYFAPLWRIQSSEDELWNRLEREKRRTIRKTIQLGVTIREGNLSDLDTYYALVLNTMSGACNPWTGNPIRLLSKDFYQRVIEALGENSRARMFLADYHGEIVSGTIVLYYKDTVYGWDIGWRREFSKIAPNNLLVWEVACRARQTGFSLFDLQVMQSDYQPGIARWKKGFGIETVPLSHFSKTPMRLRVYRGGMTLFANPKKALNKIASFVRSKP